MPDLVMRQLEMLSLIPKGTPGISTADIEATLSQKGFSVSRRTIQRDLEKLSSVYPLTCDSTGRANLWYYLRESAQVLIPAMDLNTALTLKLAEHNLQPLIPQRVRAFLEPYYPIADRVLSSHPSRLKSWMNKTRVISLGLQQVTPQINASVWDELSQAILDQVKCEVAYQAHKSDEPKTYRISPLAIVIRGPVTYLLAIYEGYDDIRQMALHRFHSARTLVDAATLPDNFSIDAYIKVGHFGILHDPEPQALELMLSPSLARILREAPLTEDQELVETLSGPILRCRLPESWDLYRWLLSHSMELKVLSPEHIKQNLIQYLEGALDKYQSRISAVS